MTAPEPLVYVVVLNWKGYAHTRKAIQSIAANSYQNYRLIAVDNGSQDGSVEALQKEFPQFTFLVNEANLGFSKGCNVGIREALKDDNCAYVLLLNNDATILPDSLRAAVAFAENDPTMGAVSGKVLLSQPPHTIWYAGGRIDYWRAQAVIRGFGEIDRGQYETPCDTGFVTGALMLISRAALAKVGLLPEEYFFGVEEWDFSTRIQRAGLKLYYVPGFVAYHAADGSHWNYDPKFVYNAYRNKLIFQQAHLPRWLFPFWKAAFAFYGKYFATRARKRLIKRGLFEVTQTVEFDHLDFALAKAIEDHGKNPMSEDVLNLFERELREHFQTNGRPHAPGNASRLLSDAD